MTQHRSFLLRAAIAAAVLSTVPLAAFADGGLEPNVKVSRLGMDSDGQGDDWRYFGAGQIQINGDDVPVRAYAAASTSCNVGGVPAEWIDGDSGRHPVIAPNIHRIMDGRFEQVGLGWLKHSFCAVSEPTCGSCSVTDCSSLGVGCADTYWADLNGNQNGLGPRSQINPWPDASSLTPSHVDPHPEPVGFTTLRGRTLVRDTDIEAGNAAGGRFVYEIHYLTHDEPYDRRYDNASWRWINLDLTEIDTSGIIGGQGQASVHREPAIYAWQDEHPDVVIQRVNPPGDGAFFVASRVIDRGDGTWEYIYAIDNMNSDRAAGVVTVAVDPAATITADGFHAPFHHSGEIWDNTPWTFAEGAGTASWSTTPHATDPDANAIRWSTIYTFRFTADTPPVDGALDIGLFKPPVGETVSVTVGVPGPPGASCPGDSNGDGTVNVDDLNNVVLDWGTDGSANGGDVAGATPGAPPDGVVDVNDLNAVIVGWGTCP